MTTTATPTKPCAGGCTSLGSHQPQCPCAGPGHKPAHDDHCDGCQPRPAEFGVLCRGCHRRLTRALADVPDLVLHLRAHVAPSWQVSDGGSVSGTREAPAPLSLDAVDAADELVAAVASWVVEVLEVHPEIPRIVVVDGRERRVVERIVPPPRLDDVRWSRSYTQVDVDGRVYVQRPRPIGAQAEDNYAHGDVVRDLCSWLRRHLGWIEEQAWSPALARELDDLVRTDLARWPFEPRGHRIEQVPCPSCENLTLWWSPPSAYLHESVVRCEREDCLHEIPEVSWPRYARRIEDARRIEQRAARRAVVQAAREAELAAEKERTSAEPEVVDA